MRESSGAVVELVVHARRDADQHERVKRRRALGQRPKATLGGIEELILPEEVFASVARDAELGQHHQLGTIGLHGISSLGNTGVDVSVHVGHAHLGRAGGDLDESILHGHALST